MNVKKTKEIVIEESDRRMIQLAIVGGTVKLTSEWIQKLTRKLSQTSRQYAIVLTQIHWVNQDVQYSACTGCAHFKLVLKLCRFPTVASQSLY